jgi:hypothetical protein
LINLSNLTSVVVDEGSRLYLWARNGGRIDLRKLSSLSTGAVIVLADGVNSVIDLRGVTAFISSGNYSSSLTVANNGSIVFNDQAFLLANVSINIPSGNPLLPPTLIASPTLTLYGKPWHSYWIEKRDTRQALNPWLFAARVPLTNSFQPFAPAPLPDTEFRLFDFVANPPILDLVQAANHQVQIVLYGTPNTTAQVVSKTEVQPPSTWQTWSTIAMTNAFRIFPPASPADPRRFFKATQL